jgi:hypothetical protein
MDLEGLLKAIGDGALETISTEATDASAEVAMEEAFDGVEGIDKKLTIQTDETGERYIKRGDFKLSLKNMKIKFEGDIDSKSPPDLKTVFEVFSGDIDFKSDDFQEINSTQIDEFKNSPGMADVNDLDASTSDGKSIADDAGGNPTGDDIQERMNELEAKNKARFDELQKKFDKIKEDAKNDKKKTWGQWTKDKLTDAAKLAAIGLGSFAFYEMVKEHQDSMNGCWLIETSTGNKCKIPQLTCNADARKAGTSCAACNEDCASTFNPCPGVKCKATDGTTNNPFPGSNCKNCCKATDGTKDTCLPDQPLCTDDGCDPMCSSSSYRNIPQGYGLKCVNVDWWTALADGVGGLGGDVDSLLKKILQWLLIGLAIIVGIIILVYGVKFAISEING